MTGKPDSTIAEIDEILSGANGEAAEGSAPVVPVARRPKCGGKLHDVVRDGRAVEVMECNLTDAEYDEIANWDARARVDGRPPLSQRPKTMFLRPVLACISELHGAGGLWVPKRIEAGGLAYRGLYYDYAQDPEHWFAASCVASNSQPLWFAVRGVCGAIRVRIFLNQHLPADQVNVVWGKNGTKR